MHIGVCLRLCLCSQSLEQYPPLPKKPSMQSKGHGEVRFLGVPRLPDKLFCRKLNSLAVLM